MGHGDFTEDWAPKGGEKAHKSTKPNTTTHSDAEDEEVPDTMKVIRQVWSSIGCAMATDIIVDCCIQHSFRGGSHPTGHRGASARTESQVGQRAGKTGMHSDREQESSKAGRVNFASNFHAETR